MSDAPSAFDEIDGRIAEISSQLGEVMRLMAVAAREVHAAKAAKDRAETERDAARAEVAALRARYPRLPQLPFPYHPYPQPYWGQLPAVVCGSSSTLAELRRAQLGPVIDR